MTRVEYDPEIMWFDYQSLFDKTRNTVLDIDCNIEIKHIDFKDDECAANVTGLKKILNFYNLYYQVALTQYAR